MAWAWFFPAEKTLAAKIWSIFVMVSLESQATDGKPRDVVCNEHKSDVLEIDYQFLSY